MRFFQVQICVCEPDIFPVQIQFQIGLTLERYLVSNLNFKQQLQTWENKGLNQTYTFSRLETNLDLKSFDFGFTLNRYLL